MLPEALAVKADVVILGSSHARHHYVPDILEDKLGMSVYNLGSNGQGIAYMRGVVDILLGHYLPKVIVFNISPALFSAAEHNLTKSRVATLSVYIDESAVVRELIYGNGPFEKIKYLFRAFRFNDLPLRYLYNFFFPRKDLVGLKGFAPAMQTFIPNPKPTTRKAEKKFFDPQAVDLFRAAVFQAKTRGVQIVFVQSPLYQLQSYQFESSLRPLVAVAQELAACEQIPFIRITPQEYSQFKDPRLFADATHLNYEGAKVFSDILATRLAEGHMIKK